MADTQPPVPARSPPPPPLPPPESNSSKPSLATTLRTRLLSILSASANTPLNILRLVQLLLTALLRSPSLTGILLLLLTRGPERVREKLRGGIGAVVLLKAQEKSVRGVVRALSVLFGLGVLRRANEAANAGGAGKEKLVDGEGQPVPVSRGEIVVVTGGCSGIGKEIVSSLLEGAGRGKVTVVVVDVQVLPEEFEEHDEIIFYFCDLASSASIHEACSAIRNEVGDPSVLINNAGIARSCDLLDDDDAYNDRLFRVNVLALFTLVREFVPAMLAAKKGHVVTIASTASFVTPPGLVDYCASKAAALSLHEGLSTELRTRYAAIGGRHILTSVVHPDWVGTTLVNGWKASLASTGQTLIAPRAVANKVVANVLEARPGQIFLPEVGWVLSALRATPHWLQDAYRDGIGKQTVVVTPTTKGKEKERQRERERDREREKEYEVLEG
ncbi:hypothetical protein IWX49DRAFT_536769 [Phyllosticta citricarpa]|uniref:Uncharacterized protein n=2 Tax=Phyllosticta TaxID=121621 RepID=A0ABR1MD26_9PEZI